LFGMSELQVASLLIHGHASPTLRLAEVIGALSYALDLTEGQPPGHSLRCGWIGMQIAASLGFDEETQADLLYTLLLKDTGCSSNAARLWELYGGDERRVKHDFKTVDAQSTGQVARFVLRHAGRGETLARRVGRLLTLVRHGQELATEVIQARCERGAAIAGQLGFGARVAAGIYSLDEHWNGGGRPEGLAGAAIPLGARIALLAQVVDVFHTVGGPESARAEAAKRAGAWFDPGLVGVFLTLSQTDAFWRGLDASGLAERVAGLEPLPRAIFIDDARLDTITAAFADVVDAKSPYTAGHSRRVADYSAAIAAGLGFSVPEQGALRRAALLHDVGKLGVSNGILDKPGKLDSQEWEEVRRHPVLSQEILTRVSVFRPIAALASAHHERLDGRGYPNKLEAGQIALETRIISAADVFDAITAERPYRGAVPVAECLGIMQRDRGTAIDGTCLDALVAHVGEAGRL
jgi:HD-GYP domain-containing protein (c-di-GMP phosphodiesterase class II)